ncbi:hypothetical protein CVT24_001317 [Panaeolus cyanescens]|uniref:Cytochrome P450 n=1 Tax=Panaeolus cyanescens TaxID=181874 RepID=A0A409VTX5_9AGAR|nr:hypothetical protein CVT24_001317 [Panaeolus cyanescens]
MEIDLTSTAGIALQCTLATGVILLLRSYTKKKRSAYPPGPKGLPFIGNVLDMPRSWPCKTFSEWSKTYGDIIYLNMIGKPMIIINSKKAAKDLLDKRSNIYSDRPKLNSLGASVMLSNLLSRVGWDKSLVLLPYGNEWRQQRKLIVQDLAPSECHKYYGLQEREMRLLVRSVLTDPGSLIPEIRLRIGTIIVRTAYGYDVKSIDDPLLANGLQTIHDGSIAAEPGRFLVDFIPWLKYVPPWLPGTGFLQTAKRWKKTFNDATWKPIQFCRDNLHNGKMLMPNICGNVYQNAGWDLDADVERQLGLAAATILGGGLDSSISTAMSFFMQMILNPEVQKKAQTELDKVVGNDRLPAITDRPDLPYINSVMTEVYRIAAPFPLSLPHASNQDDVYEGMLIPKGSVILPNVWHMLHDPEQYPQPMKFLPERYNGQESEMEKVKDVVFGFGRRVCPGNHFAEGTFFSLIATTLATCDILPGLDENGNEIMPNPEAYVSTTIITKGSLFSRSTYSLPPRRLLEPDLSMSGTLFTSPSGLVFQCALAAGALLLVRSIAKRGPSNLPPGPKGVPIIGNVLQMPKLWPWKTFSVWAKQYGDIIHLNMLGQPLIIINSRKVAADLLDKRSNIYSDRPKLEMISLVGWDRSLVLLPYGHEWRQQRKLIAQDFSPSHCPQYYGLQEKEARVFVRNMLEDSKSFLPELTLRMGAIMLRTTYGCQVDSVNDPLLANGLQTIHDGSVAAEPGWFLVYLIPWLKYLPPWLPGTGFLQTAKKWRQTFHDATWGPIEFCKANFHTGKMLMPNICGNIYQDHGWELDADTERQLAMAASNALTGGLDSNVSSTMTFFMFMILNPDTQKKAQAELDRVVGVDRLPSINDRPNLPYIRSIMTEVYRFAPAFPLSIPHTSTQDDIYEDMLIPKGSVILPNVWHMLHDPDMYPNPMEFIPERFQGQASQMEMVKDVVFGFGRRVCPGNHFAEGTFFSLIATTLATCNILPGLDEMGHGKLPDPLAYTSTTISFPEAFPVRLRARSRQAQILLSEAPDNV